MTRTFLDQTIKKLKQEIIEIEGLVSHATTRAVIALINKDVEIKEGLLNTIEMAYRAYDPCMACATHTLPGQMPLELTIRDPEGEIIDKLTQYID